MNQRTVADQDRAINLFKKATEGEPRSALAWSYVAESQRARGFFTGDARDIAAAEISAKTAVGLNANLAEPHKAMSHVLHEQGRFRESLESALIAYELSDSDGAGLIGQMGDTLRMLGDPVRAAAWYGITKGNRPALNGFVLADCLADLTDDEQAAAEYERASLLQPELPEGWMGLCRLALLQKHFDKAHKIASENWIRYRDFVFSEEMAAQVAFFSRNFSEAEKLYRELAAKNPNGGGSFYGAVSYRSALARLRLASEEKTSRQILHDDLTREMEALQSAPNHPEILYRVAAIESSLGRVELALKHLRAAMEAGWIDYRSTQLDPRFDAVGHTPTFQELISLTASRVNQMRLVRQSHMQQN
jgi:tetratricopeptide (TPR) repeat protein